MGRGGGGGFHSSFSHSSFGGSHSSYHHSSSSSHSSSHSSYHHSTSSASSNRSSNALYNTTIYNSTLNSGRKSSNTSCSTSDNTYNITSYYVYPNKSDSKEIKRDIYNSDKNSISRMEMDIIRANKILKAYENSIVYKYRKMFLGVFIILWSIVIACAIKVYHIYSSTYSENVINNFQRLDSNQCKFIDEWYTDNWGTWIYNEETLIDGLRYFYDVTGSQPYVYITGEEGSRYTSESKVRDLAEEIYNEKFDDSGHVILVFREYPDSSGDWYADVYTGNVAANILGDDVSNIVMKNVIKYYDYSTISDEELFALSFKEAADTIKENHIIREVNVDESYKDYRFVAFLLLLIVAAASSVSYYSYFDVNESIANSKSTIDLYKRRIETARKRMEDIENTYNESAKCKNCSAEIKINALGYGKCPYCGTMYNDKGNS